ncbi:MULTISPECIES: adenine phosphoribosyltransferase [Pseudoalteromonas]|uniref:Adenine phosphoribosyltransferase n=1 Tax=Pseudoalteromonas rubra TaxID=43658 RepID=A0A8T0CDP8_9GAMM|nr:MULTISPECIES: adenine phosphoribosyltransferase [Pseudoalteromonas]KAF7788488.1 hypothetical protein PRUB_a3169 [Pseudoalteromonas rubra]MCG7562688.1 adenine phosphoribosyltransferase [Pseudoalteromonas sp. McH1-42]
MISQHIAIVQDHPKPGIKFHDITSLLSNAHERDRAITQLTEHYRGKVNCVAAIDALGFIIGAMVADRLNLKFVPIRKPGKLPRETISTDYSSEYAHNSLHIHKDDIDQDDHILLIDDVLGTGGTCLAAIKLCEQLGAHVVGTGFLLELPSLGGRNTLEGYHPVCCAQL